MSKKRVFIIHGWGANPGSNWFPWIKQQLNKRGIEVVIPYMPDTLTPDFDAWFSYIKNVVVKPDKNTYLIGHSLGVITILRFLESLDTDPQTRAPNQSKHGTGQASTVRGRQQIGGAVLVSGFCELPSPVDHLPWLGGFVEKPVNYNRIKKAGGTMVIIHSDNDHLVPQKNAEILKNKLDAKCIIVSGAGHFLIKQSPIILKTILKVMAS